MPHKRNQTLILGLIVGGVALSLFLAGSCLVGVLVLSPGKAGTGPASSQSYGGKMTRDEFRKEFSGKTPEEVLKALGRPRTTNDIGGATAWNYGGLTVDPVSGRPDTAAVLWFRDGVVTTIELY